MAGIKLPIQIKSYRYGRAWIAFNQMMEYFKTGKKAIYVHKDFVMIDTNTWIRLQKQTKPKTVIYYDEASDLKSKEIKEL